MCLLKCVELLSRLTPLFCTTKLVKSDTSRESQSPREQLGRQYVYKSVDENLLVCLAYDWRPE